jgi:spore maturation protein CgeB
MKIVIFGLSITSAWGNGHATTFRALCEALHARGHRITFLEKNLEWYASNRDLPHPAYCDLIIYESWSDVLSRAKRELAQCDVAMVGSYFPDGYAAIDLVIESNAPVKAFYDIDTPITVAQLRERDKTDYLRADQIRGFDVYFSFTGGPMLRELEKKFGAQRAVPLYCSFDPASCGLCEPDPEYACDLSYMGTYAPDRQLKLEELFCDPARRLPDKKFLLAGPQYPAELKWPKNVGRIVHLEPKLHPSFYCSSRMTLNLTRKEMVAAGYSPSVRLFEAAGCGATIVSDSWQGLESFFIPGEEILVPSSSQDVIGYLTEMNAEDVRCIGRAAQRRVLAEHSSEQRALEFENEVGSSREISSTCPATA